MLADSPLAVRIRDRLLALDSHNLRRSLRPPAGIDLSSNDYLNLSTDERVTRAFVEGAECDGVGSTGSRLLRGDRAAFHHVEEQFAAFKGTERALFFSSGYLANLAVLTALTEKGDVLFSDARNHASLIDGAKLSRAEIVVVPHNDLDALADLLRATPCEGVRFVVVESLYSMDGDLARLAEYRDLCRAMHATLIVDAAHAVGVCGASGSGAIEDAGIDANDCLSVNTAGKALGVSGAFVAGPAWAIEHLVQRARPFIFSTAAPPAVAHAIAASLRIIRAEPQRRERLRARAAYLRHRLNEAGIDTPAGLSHIISVVIGDNERTLTVAARLQSAGFDARAIRPPSVPEGTARLRLSVNAGLDEAVLDRFVRALVRALA
ncbi:MAG: 8-amino-7-oxononanoate synthase [Acidobacteriaceae bacterium]|jgi:8-amino-7-oxononanoate synthase|nr:8-amino-7-oxononanoate synthase [Acidobacteriaceae bacterium]